MRRLNLNVVVLACGLALSVVSQSQGLELLQYPTAKNVAALGTVTVSQTLAGSPAVVNDQSGTNQIDVGPVGPGSYIAITWPNNPQAIDRFLMEQTTGHALTGYEVQVAKVGVANPNPANAGDWETLPGGTFAGLPNTAAFSALSPNVNRTGVRVLTTDTTNTVDGRVRLREIWAFDNYNNLAQSAAITAPGWTGGGPLSQLVDEQTANAQVFTSNVVANQNVTFTWNEPQMIGGVLIHGGAGAANEFLKDYIIQQQVAPGVWQNVVSVVGSSTKSVYHDFANASQVDGLWVGEPLLTDGLRLVVLTADQNPSNNFARLAEVFIFGVEALQVPEPSTLALVGLALPLVGLNRRRRQNRAAA